MFATLIRQLLPILKLGPKFLTLYKFGSEMGKVGRLSNIFDII